MLIKIFTFISQKLYCKQEQLKLNEILCVILIAIGMQENHDYSLITLTFIVINIEDVDLIFTACKSLTIY